MASSAFRMTSKRTGSMSGANARVVGMGDSVILVLSSRDLIAGQHERSPSRTPKRSFCGRTNKVFHKWRLARDAVERFGDVLWAMSRDVLSKGVAVQLAPRLLEPSR